jgi:CPA1 family monovalent cation:H+ antiporter
MDEAELPHAIELLVGLLGLAAFVAIVARPLRLPYTVALVIAGLAVGIAAGAAGIPSLPVSSDVVLLVLLPGLVFEAGYRLRFAELRRWFRGLALLAIPGVVISAGIVAIVLNLATGLRLDLAFIVGAMVSATDPAAVVATFKRLRVRRRCRRWWTESLLNDGTGLVLFAIALQVVVAPIGPGRASSPSLGLSRSGVAIGLATGVLAARIIVGGRS